LTPRFKHPKGLVLASCVALLALFGWIDYLTGYEMGFFIFYSLPVGLAAWHLGAGPGIVMAFAAALTWWLADRLAGEKYSSAFLFFWNTAVHFGAFVINAVAIAKIKTSLDQRHRLQDELDQMRTELRRLKSLLPLCPVCRKPHAPEQLRRRAEAYLDGQPDVPGEDARCESCRAAAEAKASVKPTVP
jgi:hypothetical protein